MELTTGHILARWFSSAGLFDMPAIGGFETACSGFANIQRLGLAFERFHFDGEMVDAECVMKFCANSGKQFGMQNGWMMADMRRERVDAGRDGPDVQVVHAADAFGFQDGRLDNAKIDMPRRAFEQDVDGFDD